MNRAGTTVLSEEMDVPIAGGSGPLKISVDNGDNPPLAISAVQLLSVERRIYFDPQGKSVSNFTTATRNFSPRSTTMPGFSRLIRRHPRRSLVLAPTIRRIAGRPDDRPWSERHKAVMWLAMLLAVVVLAALAIQRTKNNALSS